MNIKKLAMALSITAAFCYMGCDESSTSPATGGDEQPPVLSSDSNGGEGDENAVSSSSNEAVGGDEQTAASSDSNEEAASSSSDVAAASSADIGGQVPFDTTGLGSMLKCDEAGATKNYGMGITATCVDGQWVVDSSSVADLRKCSPDGDTMEMMGTVMVCKDGNWEVDSAATEAASKCDEEGATKTEPMSMGGFEMEMKYVCKDGEWIVDMSSFGGGMPGGEGGGNWNMGDSTGASQGRSDWGKWLTGGDSSSTLPGGNGGMDFGNMDFSDMDWGNAGGVTIDTPAP